MFLVCCSRIAINALVVLCVVDTFVLKSPVSISRGTGAKATRQAEPMLINKGTIPTGTIEIRKNEDLISHSIHLVSLPEYSELGPRSLRDIWKWKDISLGDGRDFFVPRPRAIKDLTSLILDQNNTFGYKVKECAILSNCARLDVYLALEKQSISIGDLDMKLETSFAAKLAVSEVLANQITSFRSKPDTNKALKGMTAFLDLPGFIDMNTRQISPDTELIKEIASELQETHDIRNITHHACLVACGMANRPRRPVREVHFRPFSARDAHIMLQLKRTVECGIGPNIITILNAALQAGKAARDPKIVPEINLLIDYSSTGKYAPIPPISIANTTYHAVMKKAIQPTIEKCILKLLALQASESIQILQQNVDDLFRKQRFSWNTTHGKIARSLLHEPIQNLRLHKSIDMNQTIQLINRTIHEYIDSSI